MRLSGQDYTFDMITHLYHICTVSLLSFQTAAGRVHMMFDTGSVYFSEDTEHEHCHKHLSVCS